MKKIKFRAVLRGGENQDFTHTINGYKIDDDTVLHRPIKVFISGKITTSNSGWVLSQISSGLKITDKIFKTRDEAKNEYKTKIKRILKDYKLTENYKKNIKLAEKIKKQEEVKNG